MGTKTNEQSFEMALRPFSAKYVLKLGSCRVSRATSKGTKAMATVALGLIRALISTRQTALAADITH